MAVGDESPKQPTRSRARVPSRRHRLCAHTMQYVSCEQSARCQETYAWVSVAIYASAVWSFVASLKDPYAIAGWSLATAFTAARAAVRTSRSLDVSDAVSWATPPPTKNARAPAGAASTSTTDAFIDAAAKADMLMRMRGRLVSREDTRRVDTIWTVDLDKR